MGVKANDFGSIIIQKRVGFKGDFRLPDAFLPTRIVGEGLNGRNENDGFGYSVAIDGHLAVVGVPSQSFDETGESTEQEAGAVFVYRRTYDSWEFAYKISAPDAKADANFGYAVDLRGSSLIVGSPKHAAGVTQETAVEGAGQAYIFEVTDQAATLASTLAPTIRDENDEFGATVRIDDTMAFVGSPLHDRNNMEVVDKVDAGAFWAYTRDGNGSWALTKKVVAGGNDRNVNDNFGTTMSAHGNMLVVGVPNYDYAAKGVDYLENSGAAYVFEWRNESWKFKEMLTAPERAPGDLFGSAVATHNRKIVVGAKGTNEGVGAAYVFTSNAVGRFSVKETLTPTIEIMPEGYAQPTNNALLDGAAFGSSVSINATTILVGAPKQTVMKINTVDNATPKGWTGTATQDAGVAYFYNLGETVELFSTAIAGDRFTSITGLRESGNFGASVSLASTSDVAAIGEPLADLGISGGDARTDAGLAYVYMRGDNGFEMKEVLEGFYNERGINDAFATAFAVNSRFIAFGAPGQDYNSDGSGYIANAGAVYIWELTGKTWTYRQKITAGTRSLEQRFGTNITLLDDRLFVSSKQGNNAGAVSVFKWEKTKFVLTQTIAPAALAANDDFGATMLATSDILAVSAPNRSAGGVVGHGQVFLFKLNAAGQYVDEGVVQPSTLKEAGSKFGHSLGYDNGVLVVGAPHHSYDTNDDNALTNSGAAFVFTKTSLGWTQIHKLGGPATDRDIDDHMGYCVESYGNMLAVGVPFSDRDENIQNFMTNAGKVLIFTFNNGVWAHTAKIASVNREVNGNFGNAISLDKDRILIGAVGERNVGISSKVGDGRAYVFDLVDGEWIHKATLDNGISWKSDYGSRFGHSLKLRGNKIIVGEPWQKYATNGADSANGGVAHIFELVGDVWTRRAKVDSLPFGPRTTNEYFGLAVDINDSIAAIGAPFHMHDSTNELSLSQAGAGFIFRRVEAANGSVSWAAERKIAGWIGDRLSGDRFGSAVATNGEWVAVSATQHDYDSKREDIVSNAGAVFVYRWEGDALVFKQKIVNPVLANRIENSYFGTTLFMTGNRLFVGMPNWSSAVTNSGMVVTFKNDNGFWTYEQTLMPRNPSATNRFGFSISSNDEWLVVGAPTTTSIAGVSGSVSNSGSVDLFKFDGKNWVFKQTIYEPKRVANDYFGRAVTIVGDVIVVGALNNDNSDIAHQTSATNAGGAVFVFHKNANNDTWAFSQKLISGKVEGNTTDNFGLSVSVDGETMVVGIPRYNYNKEQTINHVGSGGAAVFSLIDNEWVMEQIIVPENPVSEGAFGTSVAVSGDTIVVGAPKEPATPMSGINAGAGYIFTKKSAPKGTRYKKKTARFAATGASQSFVVPEKAENISVYAWGAAGNGSAYGLSGNGGFVFADIPVTAGETLTVNVGVRPTGIGAGGGRTELLRGETTLFVAAGGGGSNRTQSASSAVGQGGSGGGLFGTDGLPNFFAYGVLSGVGGTQTEGGKAKEVEGWINGGNGGPKQGGDSPVIGGWTLSPGGWPNGGRAYYTNDRSLCGGGDGWFGGSAGSLGQYNSLQTAAGGGGSSYLAPGLNGYTRSVKDAYDDAAQALPQNLGYMPGANNSGYVVIEWLEAYDHYEWELTSRVVPNSNFSTSLNFGARVAINGDIIAIAATGGSQDSNGTNRPRIGVVYTYDRLASDWEFNSKLYQFGLNPFTETDFGDTITINANYIVVGAPNNDYDESGRKLVAGQGGAYIYRNDDGAWIEWQRISIPGNAINAADRVGEAISTSGDWVAVGAPGDDYIEGGGSYRENAGSVHMWKWEDGTLVFKKKLSAPLAYRDSYASFGKAIHLEGDEILIGAPGYTFDADGITKVETEGKVFVFKFNETLNEWAMTSILSHPAGVTANSDFGFNVVRSGDRLAIGAPGIATSALRLEATTTMSYIPVRQIASGNLFNGAMTLDFKFFYTTASVEILKSRNHGSRAFNTMSVRITGSTLRIYLRDSAVSPQNTTGRERFTLPLTGIVAANSWIDVQIRIEGTRMTVFVNGVNRGSEYVSATEYPQDFRNGIILGTRLTSGANATAFSLYEYVRLSKAIEQPLNATKSNGLSANTIMFADYMGRVGDIAGNFTIRKETRNNNTVAATGYLVQSPFTPTTFPGGHVSMFERVEDKWEYHSLIQVNDEYPNERRFGESFDFHDDVLVVGSPTHTLDEANESPLADAGAAWFFMYEDMEWKLIQKITGWGQDSNSGDLAGHSIARNGNIIAVGSPYHAYDESGMNYTVNAGAVHIWKHDGTRWTLEQKLVAPTRTTNGRFGNVVEMIGNRLFVGGVNGDNSGSGFMFERDPEASLLPWSDGVALPVSSNANDEFGFTAAFVGEDELIVGAPGHSFGIDGTTNTSNAGAAYVFKHSGSAWTMNQKIVDDGTHTTGLFVGVAANARFGASLFAGDNELVIGSPTRSADATFTSNVTSRGAIIAYKRDDADSPYQQTQVVMPRAQGNISASRVGSRVVVRGDTMLVSSLADTLDSLNESPLANAGSVRVYKYVGSEWQLLQKISAPIGDAAWPRHASMFFGRALALDEANIFIGSPNANRVVGSTTTTRAGSVVQYTYDEETQKYEYKAFFTAPTPRTDGIFGYSIDSDGDTLLISGPGHSTAGTAHIGVVWVYNRTGDNVFTLNLTFSDPELTAANTYTNIGRSLVVRGNTAIIGGSAGQTVNRNWWDFIYVLERDPATNNWSRVDRINTPNPLLGSANFGLSTAFTEDQLFVGVNSLQVDERSEAPFSNAGGVMVFDRLADGSFAYNCLLVAEGTGNRGINFFMGERIMINRGRLFVSAHGCNTGLTGTASGAVHGAVFVFDRTPSGRWKQSQKIIPEGYQNLTLGNFGIMMVAHEDRIFISSPSHQYGNVVGEGNFLRAGAVYHFIEQEDKSITFHEKLVDIGASINRANYTEFGRQLSINGNELLIAATNNYSEYGTAHTTHGIAYNFRVMNSSDVTAKVVSVFDPTTTATVAPTVSGGIVNGVSVTNGGSGYTELPTIEFNTPGYDASVVMAPTSIASVTLVGGAYPKSVTHTIERAAGDTTGTGFTISQVTGQHAIQGVTVANAGSHTATPTITVSGNTGAVLRGVLAPTTVAGATASNTTPLTTYPTITANTPVGGSEATFVVETELASIFNVGNNVSTLGQKYYLNGQEITVSALDGNKATAFDFTGPLEIDSAHPLNAYPIYSSLTEPVGQPVLVSLRVNITGVQVVNAGSGYTGTPVLTTSGAFTASVTLTPSALAEVIVENGGEDVTSNHTVSISGGATGTLVLDEGMVTDLVVATAGSGWTKPPVIKFSDGVVRTLTTFAPTSVASVVLNSVNPAVDGTKKLIRIKRFEDYYGARSVTRYGQTMGTNFKDSFVVASAAINPATTTPRDIGRVVLYDVKRSRNNHARVEGWIDASSVAPDLENEFTISAWFKTNNHGNAKSLGTIFSTTDSLLNADFTAHTASENGSFTIPSKVNGLRISAWGDGSDFDSASPRNGGLLDITINVNAGDVISYTRGIDYEAGILKVYLNSQLIGTVGSGHKLVTRNIDRAHPDTRIIETPTATTLPIALNYDKGPIAPGVSAAGAIQGIGNLTDLIGTVNNVSGGIANNRPVIASSVTKSLDDKMVSFEFEHGVYTNSTGSTFTNYVPLKHTRSVYSPDSVWVRVVDTLENTGDTAISIVTHMFMGYVSETAYMATDLPNGRIILSPTSSTAPNLIVKTTGLGGETATQTGTDTNAARLRHRYRLTVNLAAGEKKSYVWFFIRANSNYSTALLAEQHFDTIGWGERLRGLSDQTIRQVANFGNQSFYDVIDNPTTTTTIANATVVNAGSNHTLTPLYDGNFGNDTMGKNTKTGGIVIAPPEYGFANNDHCLQVTNEGRVWIGDNNDATYLGEVGRVTDGEWHNVVYTADGNEVRVFFDGEYVGSGTAHASITPSTTISFGAKFAESAVRASKDGFVGVMSDITVWNKTLTDEQAESLVDTSVDEVEANAIVAAWLKN